MAGKAITVQFQREGDVDFEAVVGAVFNEEYSETLDSFSIVVKHSKKKLDIKPYDFVLVKYGADWRKEMIVDSIFWRRVRNSGELLYEFTVKLMSETKLLEKIQLPNRSFTHPLNGSLRDAYEVILDLMLYVPRIHKILFGTDVNENYPLITINSSVDTRFRGLLLKDITLSRPTLRQALTAVMSQFGCIPVVINRQLNFIDFNQTKKNDIDLSAMDSIQGGNSSDSYVNTLVSNVSDVLDENIVTERLLSFRNRDEGILKQTSNLELNVSLPIYKVTNVSMYQLFDGIRFVMNNKLEEPLNMPPMSAGVEAIKGFVVRLFGNNIPNGPMSIRLVRGQIRSFNVVTQGNNLISCVPVDIDDLASMTVTLDNNLEFMPIKMNRFKTGQYYWIHFYFTHQGGAEREYYFNSLSPLSNTYRLATSRLYDITPLVKEVNSRKLLSYDFTQPPDGDIDGLAKYYYTTVQYKIGDTKITGWSQTYDYAEVWWKRTNTVIQTIVNKIYSTFSSDAVSMKNLFLLPSQVQASYGTSLSGNTGFLGLQVNPDNIKPEDLESGSENYVYRCVFDVSYQPMNQINFKTKKKDLSSHLFPIEQLDTKQNGIVNFDALSLAESDKIERLGNEVITCIKRYFGDFNEANSYQLGDTTADGYVIFKRSIVFKQGYYDITYYLCKDYVISNYSTSISTKYRAFQYIDYSQATQRDENRVTYLLITKNPNVNDPRISLKGLNLTNLFFQFAKKNNKGNLYTRYDSLSQGAFVEQTVRKVNSSGEDSLTNSNMMVGISVMNAPGSLIVHTKSYDTVSYGNWVENSPRLGGVPQHLYMKNGTNNLFQLPKLALMNNIDKDSFTQTIGDKNRIYEIPNITFLGMREPAIVFDFQLNYNSTKQDQSELLGFSWQFVFASDVGDECKIMNGLIERNAFRPNSTVMVLPWNRSKKNEIPEIVEESDIKNIVTMEERFIVIDDAGKIDVGTDLLLIVLERPFTRLYRPIMYLEAGTYYLRSSQTMNTKSLRGDIGSVPRLV